MKDNMLPKPLEIRLGQGYFAVCTFVGDGKDDEAPGILLAYTGKKHKVGGLPESKARVHVSQPGEIYIVIENIEAAVVLQDMLTATMRRLCGFPEYLKDESEADDYDKR